MADQRPCLWVLAGTNGAGKSSIGGALLRQSGGDYFNPDEVAASILRRERSLSREQANARAWVLGVRLLDDAIRFGRDHFFETTLGGDTIAARLMRALRGWSDSAEITPLRRSARPPLTAHRGGR